MEVETKLESISGKFGSAKFYPLYQLGDWVSYLPNTVKILLENLLRNYHPDLTPVIEEFKKWPNIDTSLDLPFKPARVLLQDFTGVPAIVDLAAMRSALARLGFDPEKVDPLIPVDLVIDHSVQVDVFGIPDAYVINLEREYGRNSERYALLKWAQQAFKNFRVVPPGMGIVHQVNLEYLGKVVMMSSSGPESIAYPDTLVGTDSHTPMINGLGVLGWGVGGIEAEACMLGQPLYMQMPVVVGVELKGEPPAGATATDLVLTLTQLLRKHGVVGKFVEFFGEGLSTLSIADRATLSNMSPEFGATASLFPIDKATLDYMKMTGRDDELIDLVERYSKVQGLYRDSGSPAPRFSEYVELDLSKVEPSLAGPKRPQDRVSLKNLAQSFASVFPPDGNKPSRDELSYGSVVISAITSCTNTSNPSVMIGAGLLAKKAVESGLKTKPWVKTSLAPGSRVVIDYLKKAGLVEYLEKLGFYLVGFGCTTCIGNSGPLPEDVARVIEEKSLPVAAILSGNRNFEGRIHPQARASYLCSPPLVVAFALAGTVMIDLDSEPIGNTEDGSPIYLRDIWPSSIEIQELVKSSVMPEFFKKEYSHIFEGDLRWKEFKMPTGQLYQWSEESTYIKEPPYFEKFSLQPQHPEDIVNARVLVYLGDSVTTDHISPAGSIPENSPAGKWLISHGVRPIEFNSYGARRGNHEVMVRGTFANIRLRNKLVDPKEGGYTVHFPDKTEMTVFEASQLYQSEGVPLIVLAGNEYGAGSSRDWAAKGPYLMGVKAVIAQSFERIHRSNLVCLGILPLEFTNGQSAESLGLKGDELYSITGISSGLEVGKILNVTAQKQDGSVVEFKVRARLDTKADLEYYSHGGIMQMVLRQLVTK